MRPCLNILAINSKEKCSCPGNSNFRVTCASYKLALCVSMVLLVLALVFTVTIAMAKIHIDMIGERLDADIREEKDLNYDDEHPNRNEMKLEVSKQSICLFRALVALALVLGLLNVFSLALTIYGITNNNHVLMRPFLFVGALSLACAAGFMVAVSTQLIPHLIILPRLFLLTLPVGCLIYVPCWFAIRYQYTYIAALRTKIEECAKSKSVIGAGGYIHTFEPAVGQDTQKTLVV